MIVVRQLHQGLYCSVSVGSESVSFRHMFDVCAWLYVMIGLFESISLLSVFEPFD